VSTATNSPLSKARLALRQATHADENRIVTSTLTNLPLSRAACDNIVDTAHAIVLKSREMTAERGTLDAFMQEFGLSNQEGVALMCLAEALLRIPNSETQSALIAEKMTSGNWADHRGSSEDLFVNAGVWAMSGKLRDIGISDNFMKELGETFTPGSSAVFVLVRKVTPDKVLDALKGFGGKILKTSLTADKEDTLREVLEKT
jgi:proline dehydrogenase